MDCLETTCSVAVYWKKIIYFMEQAINYTSNIFINGNLNVDLLRESNNKLSEIISEISFANECIPSPFKSAKPSNMSVILSILIT